jgi:hypothetical protein
MMDDIEPFFFLDCDPPTLPPTAEQEGLEVLNIIDEHEEENHEIDEEAPSDVHLPYFEPGQSLEENDIIFRQRHATSSQWRDSEGSKADNKSAIIDGA